MGLHSQVLMPGALERIVAWQDDAVGTQNRFPFQKALTEALSAAIQAITPRRFLSSVGILIVPDALNDNTQRRWLLPLLARAVGEGASLTFYREYFLSLSRMLQKKAEEYEEIMKTAEADQCKAIRSQIWAIFPGYCKVFDFFYFFLFFSSFFYFLFFFIFLFLFISSFNFFKGPN